MNVDSATHGDYLQRFSALTLSSKFAMSCRTTCRTCWCPIDHGCAAKSSGSCVEGGSRSFVTLDRIRAPGACMSAVRA